MAATRVKLDRMRVDGVHSNARTAAIVRSIVALCHGLGLEVIAEGVERAAQLEFLSHCRPISVQGYLLAYPPVETQDAEKEAHAVCGVSHDAIAPPPARPETGKLHQP